MIRAIVLLFCYTLPATAETVVAARTIPAQSVISAEDLAFRDGDEVNGESDPLLFVGMEARIALYAGRPIHTADVGFPAIVDRNQIIPLIFKSNGLVISTEGRSLARAGPGEIIRVMNLASRTTVNATIGEDGTAYVSQ